jgi:hypothetical protein
MRVIPFNMMASWPTPNYTNPARHNVGFYVLSPLLLTIATICVGARLYGRIFVRRWFGPDDILIAIAWVSAALHGRAPLTMAGVYRSRVCVLRTWAAPV